MFDFVYEFFEPSERESALDNMDFSFPIFVKPERFLSIARYYYGHVKNYKKHYFDKEET